MAGKSASTSKGQNQKSKKSLNSSKKVRHPWFTLIMSTLGCLAIVVGLYYANKVNNLKAKELKQGKFTGQQKSKRSVNPTEKPTQSVEEPSFEVKEDNLKKKFKNEKQTGQSGTKSSQTNQKSDGVASSSASVRMKTRVEEGKMTPNDDSKDETKRRSSGSSSKSNTVKKQQIKTASLADFKRVPRLDGIKVGYKRTMELEPGKNYTVITRSLRPPVFEIPNFLTDEECQDIVQHVTRKQMLEASPVSDISDDNIEATTEQTFYEWDYNKDNVVSPLEVMHNMVDLSDLYFSEKDIHQMIKDLKVDKNNNGVIDLKEFLQATTDRMVRYLHELARGLDRVKGRNSAQTWVDHTVIKGLDERVAALTRLPVVIVAESEKLQVVHYKPEGHYHCHHDSQPVEPEVPCCYERDERHCRLCRFITILYYLNDVQEGGETAFPVADNATYSYEGWSAVHKYRCDLSKHCHKANLVVPPKKGTAVMWYNHYIDPTTGWVGDLDEMTYHGGCDVIRGQKWIANNWINIMGSSRKYMITHTNPKRRL